MGCMQSVTVGGLLLRRQQRNRVDPKLAPSERASRDPQPGHVYTGVAEEPDSLNPFTTTSAVARRYVLCLLSPADAAYESRRVSLGCLCLFMTNIINLLNLQQAYHITYSCECRGKIRLAIVASVTR